MAPVTPTAVKKTPPPPDAGQVGGAAPGRGAAAVPAHSGPVLGDSMANIGQGIRQAVMGQLNSGPNAAIDATLSKVAKGMVGQFANDSQLKRDYANIANGSVTPNLAIVLANRTWQNLSQADKAQLIKQFGGEKEAQAAVAHAAQAFVQGVARTAPGVANGITQADLAASKPMKTMQLQLEAAERQAKAASPEPSPADEEARKAQIALADAKPPQPRARVSQKLVEAGFDTIVKGFSDKDQGVEANYVAKAALQLKDKFLTDKDFAANLYSAHLTENVAALAQKLAQKDGKTVSADAINDRASALVYHAGQAAIHPPQSYGGVSTAGIIERAKARIESAADAVAKDFKAKDEFIADSYIARAAMALKDEFTNDADFVTKFDSKALAERVALKAAQLLQQAGKTAGFKQERLAKVAEHVRERAAAFVDAVGRRAKAAVGGS